MFAGSLAAEAKLRGLRLDMGGAAPLGVLEYRSECELKNAALKRFWNEARLPGRAESLLPSPLPRHYRTTSKRRLWHGRRAAKANIIAAEGIFRRNLHDALLEPDAHGRIFAFLEARLQSSRPLLEALNFVIVRGTYEEFIVIFNFRHLDRSLYRQLEKAAAGLRDEGENVVAAFAFVDPSASPYYLEAGHPGASPRLKRIFGPGHFRLRIGESVFQVPPDCFSQVNESLLPAFVAQARRMLSQGQGERLLDLYCGYGLFAYTLAAGYREVFAVDASPASLRAAQAMIHLAPPATRMVFRGAAITGNSLSALLPHPLSPGMEDALLDPPRHGAGVAAVAAIARRRPGLVLHVFCAVDEIPAAVAAWRQQGYHVRRAVPLDMFAGTLQLEVMILLSPA